MPSHDPERHGDSRDGAEPEISFEELDPPEPLEPEPVDEALDPEPLDLSDDDDTQEATRGTGSDDDAG